MVLFYKDILKLSGDNNDDHRAVLLAVANIDNDCPRQRE